MKLEEVKKGNRYWTEEFGEVEVLDCFISPTSQHLAVEVMCIPDGDNYIIIIEALEPLI